MGNGVKRLTKVEVKKITALPHLLSGLSCHKRNLVSETGLTFYKVMLASSDRLIVQSVPYEDIQGDLLHNLPDTEVIITVLPHCYLINDFH